jgi:hypothetical protein
MDQQSIDKALKYEHNPRTITDRERALLDEHLREFGDLSGIVYCTRNRAYVGGNQRSDIMDGARIEIVERHKKPTATKTVAHGFVHFNDERYAYREVAFSEDEFKRACIVANNDGGSFDFNVLQTSPVWADVPLMDLGMDLPPIPASVDSIELPEFKEYDESVEAEVVFLECPECRHKFPK